MKKNLLLILAFALITSFSFSQSMQLMNDDGEVASGAVFNVTGNAADPMIFEHLYVKNVDDIDLNIYAKKIVLSEVDGSMNTFCWADLCYSPTTMVSPNAELIAPGETAIDFKGEYYPNGFEGISSIYYVWFNEENEGDSLYIKVNFNTNQYQQSLQLSNSEGVIANGYEFTVSGNHNETIALEELFVTNISDVAIDVLAKKVILDTVAGSMNSFCWANLCYGPATYISPEFASLEAQASAEDFKGEYFPSEHAGTSRIQYVFFNRADETDSVYVTVNFVANAPSAIGDVYTETVSAPYPNPANNVVYFDVKELSGNQAEVVIRNLLGSEVKRIRVNAGTSRISINTSDLNSGLYLYSVVSDGRVLNSNKLVVRH